MYALLAMLGALAAASPYQDGVDALRRGRNAAAVQALDLAVQADPAHAAAWWELGWAHWNLESWDRAAECWTRVQALQPTHPEVDSYLVAAHEKIKLGVAAAGPASIPLEPEGPGFRLVAGGDTMMGTAMRRGDSGLAPGNGELIFEDVGPLLREADIAFLNLEGPLADDLPSTKCRPDSTACYAFSTPTRYRAALVGAGVDMVSLANNHAMDLGVAGMQSTMRALDEVHIAHAGRYGDTARVERNGITVALIAAHSGSCCLNVNRVDEVAAAVRLADEWADVVVLSFHGGAEGAKARHVAAGVEVAWGERRGDVQLLAHGAIDAGADLVLGHGPHVLRGMEVYRGRLIAYSLGNFTGFRQFGTRGGYGGTTVLLDVQIAKNGVLRGARLHALALDGQSIPRLDPSGLGLAHVRELTASDFPKWGVRVGDDGRLSWQRTKSHAPSGGP